MKFAAFFRNLNLGRPPAPGKTQFEAVFVEAGASSAASFLVNGTMVFEAPSRRRAAQVLKQAQALLLEANGFKEPAFLRSVDDLASLVCSDPFAGVDRASVYEFCVTFLHPKLELPEPLPSANARGDVQVLSCTQTELLTTAFKFGASPGSPNLFAEKTFGLPASTRAWNTVVRLVQRHQTQAPVDRTANTVTADAKAETQYHLRAERGRGKSQRALQLLAKAKRR